MRGDPTILDRDDLLVREWGDFNYGAGVYQRSHRTAQDADLRELGYVRLDGVDLEALRRLVERVESKPPTRVSGPDIRWLVDAATMLLAALAEGDTTNE